MHQPKPRDRAKPHLARSCRKGAGTRIHRQLTVPESSIVQSVHITIAPTTYTTHQHRRHPTAFVYCKSQTAKSVHTHRSKSSYKNQAHQPAARQIARLLRPIHHTTARHSHTPPPKNGPPNAPAKTRQRRLLQTKREEHGPPGIGHQEERRRAEKPDWNGHVK